MFQQYSRYSLLCEGRTIKWTSNGYVIQGLYDVKALSLIELNIPVANHYSPLYC